MFKIKSTFKMDGIMLNNMDMAQVQLDCILTSDCMGKTLSVRHDNLQYSFALEPILNMLKNMKIK